MSEEKLVLAAPATFDEYIDMAGKFSALVDIYVRSIEMKASAGEMEEVAFSLPRAIGLLNAIRTLRGDHAGLADDLCLGKPRNQLYGIEADIERRVAALHVQVYSSEKRPMYEHKMNELFSFR